MFLDGDRSVTHDHRCLRSAIIEARIAQLAYDASLQTTRPLGIFIVMQGGFIRECFQRRRAT